MKRRNFATAVAFMDHPREVEVESDEVKRQRAAQNVAQLLEQHLGISTYLDRLEKDKEE